MNFLFLDGNSQNLIGWDGGKGSIDFNSAILEIITSKFASFRFSQKRPIPNLAGSNDIWVEGVGIDLSGVTFVGWTIPFLPAPAAGAVSGSPQNDEFRDIGRGKQHPPAASHADRRCRI